ncbi:MAG: cytochrome P460 family protein [Gammaproteobacteria bacterium]|nr:cytochrome P460 family protein [Gammaproteobacteria bacterium]NIR81628.1 cytochrome P460 family protein [Gammaproteobacteria bacterium]NIR88179.1 cytochrome P460 family protein [Gammaproteobacteria bacterium]NIU02740.1 cytochrome P460 family protein [Gammaproteobacteria bacterium]NIV73339.1 hypothetical protein [Gammaproteobacteria bacterium]
MRATDTAVRRASIMAMAVAAIFLGGGVVSGDEPASEEAGKDIEMSPISGPPEQPRRHFRLRSPAELTPSDASGYYDIIRGALSNGYGRSGLSAARSYQRWRRYNRAPYLSSAHGNHYLNNYANATASAYGGYEKAGELPVGSVIAKDSFAVTRTGGILLGPLFIMEKMPAGFSYVSGDWRYTLVQPDGTVLGRTKGEGAERVQYCIGCHLAVEDQDHLYFVPEPYRLAPGE